MSEPEEEVQTKNWRAIPRISRTVPFGYRVDEEDDKVLQPVVLELEALELAKKHLKKGYSYRVVCEWIEEVTGRYLSHMGLKKRVISERDRQRQASVAKSWAARYKEAQEKADELERKLGGATPERSGTEEASGTLSSD